MKKLIIALTSAAVFSLSAATLAGEDATITVIGSDITQIQWGQDQEQHAVMGLVSDEFEGEATIVIKRSNIIQKQHNRDNKQTARLGVIGCDCGDENSHRPRR